MSLSSRSPRRRLAQSGLGITVALALLTGCAQEEPLDDPADTSAPTTTSTATPEPAPTSDSDSTTDADDSPTTDAPTADAAPTTDAPSAPATDDSAVTSAGPAGTLEAKDGGFTVDVPEDWEDAIDLVDVDSVQLAMKAPEQVDGFFMNVLVTKEEYVRNLTSAVEQAAQELAGDDDYELLEAAPVDGNRAPGYTLEREVQDKTLVQTQRWVSHDGTLYVVTMSALKSQADEAAPILDELLESWRWQD